MYSERGLLLAPYLLPWARGCQSLHPFASRIIRDDTNASDRLRIPGSTLFWLDWLSKSDRLALISRGLLPVTHLLDRPTATHCLLITKWQLVKAHGVTWNEPKIHVNSHYITNLNVKRFSLTHWWDPVRWYQSRPEWSWEWLQWRGTQQSHKAPALLKLYHQIV